jgi:hypothetical protein
MTDRKRRKRSSPARPKKSGIDLGSPASHDYFDRRPFRFDGKIKSMHVEGPAD